jgi:Na+-transporting NADH:ubiquinone oxidoreductase subunit NqrC
MILNPYFWVAIVMSWVVVAVSVYEHEQTEFDKERAVAQAALDAANKHSQEITDERNKTVAYISRSLADTQTKAAAASKALDDKLASTPSSDNAGTCNIDPRAAQTLVSLTERGDAAIEKLNSCIAAYNSLLEPKQ